MVASHNPLSEKYPAQAIHQSELAGRSYRNVKNFSSYRKATMPTWGE